MAEPLKYQSRQDTERELRGSWTERWFGPSRDRVWTSLANELDAEFHAGTWLKGSYVTIQSGPWEVMLDNYVVSTGKSHTTYTRLRAPFVASGGFRFAVSRASFLSPLAKLLGAQDVSVGDPKFDESFVIKSNDEVAVARLFQNTVLRDLLLQEKYTSVRISDDGGWGGGKYPADVDLLTVITLGDIRDLDHLHRLYRIAAETLESLLVVGAADDQSPSFKIAR